MRLVLTTVIIEAIIAAAFPRGAMMLFALGVIVVVISIFALRQESLIITPLVIAMPLVAMMIAQTGVRIAGILVIVALILFALSDIAHRHRGAPLSFSRLLLWYLSGSFFLFMALFAAASDRAVDPTVVVVVAAFIGAGALYLARTAAERARALPPHRVSRSIDAWIIGLMLSEFVVAIAHLPFAVVSLAAFTVIVLWLITRTVVLSRLGQLHLEKFLQVSATAAIMVIAIALPTMLF